MGTFAEYKANNQQYRKNLESKLNKLLLAQADLNEKIIALQEDGETISGAIEELAMLAAGGEE